jgi:hypothetical protein
MKTKGSKAKKKARLSEIDRMLGAESEVEDLEAALDAWTTTEEGGSEDAVFVPHVVRRTFGTAYAPLALITGALRALPGTPDFTITDVDRRVLQFDKTEATYTLSPGKEDMLPWPRDRELELVRALVAENTTGKYGILPTRAAMKRAKAKKPS